MEQVLDPVTQHHVRQAALQPLSRARDLIDGCIRALVAELLPE